MAQHRYNTVDDVIVLPAVFVLCVFESSEFSFIFDNFLSLPADGSWQWEFGDHCDGAGVGAVTLSHLLLSPLLLW